MSLIYFDISIGGRDVGKLTFRLFDDIVPKTALNFRCLSTGERGGHLSYKNSIFHRVIPGFMCQGGDFTNRNGTGGESIYGKKFSDESFAVKHTKPGLLSMANAGPNTNGSQFFITFVPCPHLDGKHVVFGELVGGANILKMMEQVDVDAKDRPVFGQEIVIESCGLVGAIEPKVIGIDRDSLAPKKASKKEKKSKKSKKEKTSKKSKKSKKSSKKRKHRHDSSDDDDEDDSSRSSDSSSDSESDSESEVDKKRKRKHKRDTSPEVKSTPENRQEDSAIQRDEKIETLGTRKEEESLKEPVELPEAAKVDKEEPSGYIGADGILYKGRGQRKFKDTSSYGRRGDYTGRRRDSRDRFSGRDRWDGRDRNRRDDSRDRRDNSRNRGRAYRDRSRSQSRGYQRERRSVRTEPQERGRGVFDRLGGDDRWVRGRDNGNQKENGRRAESRSPSPRRDISTRRSSRNDGERESSETRHCDDVKYRHDSSYGRNIRARAQSVSSSSSVDRPIRRERKDSVASDSGEDDV